MATDPTDTAGLETVKECRLRLAELMQYQRTLLGQLGRDELTARWQAGLDMLEQKVRSDSFRVLVCGQFNRGKSTFINALLGQRVLPTFATPTTAVINEVKYGEAKAARLYPLAPGGPADDGPRDIPIEDLESYVVVDRSDTSKPNPYERVEVFWPLEMCRNGVEVIDSPGLNEDPVRERITVGYLDRADAVVFVLDATQPFTNNEHAFLELFVRPLGHEDAFFVFNKINVVDEEERDQVEIYCRRKLEPFVKYDQRIFFVDAKGALAARLAGDQDRLDRSNLPPVERSLNHFLTTQRGRLKVLVPARELQLAIRLTRAGIDQQRELLGRDLDDLLERYARNQLPLESLEYSAQRISRWLAEAVADATREVDRAAREFLEQTARQIPALVASAETTVKITINPFRIRSRTGELVNEVLEGLAGALHEQFATWRAETYAPLLAAQLERTQREIADELREFATQLDRVRLDLSELASGTGAEDETTFPLDVSGSGSGVGLELGPQHSMAGMARAVLPRAAVAVAALAIGFAPALLIPVAALWAAGGLDSQGTRLTDQVRRRIGKQAAQELLDRAPELAKEIADATAAQLNELREAVVTSLRGQIATVREQVESAVVDKRAGETRVQQTRMRLDQVERAMDEVYRQVEELIDVILALAPARAPRAEVTADAARSDG